MKRSISLGITAVLLVAGSGVSGELPTHEVVMAHMARASHALTTLEAELVQVKSYPQLSLSDPAEKGRLYVERGGQKGTRLRLEMAEPEPRTVVLEDGEYVFYQPKIKQAVVGKWSGDRGKAGFLSYLLGDLSAAEEDFEIRSLGEELIDGKPTVRLRLSAKPESKSPYRQIDLWVDKVLWLPVRQDLTELNHSLTRIELHDISINGDIRDEVFEIELPRDVERVRG